MRLSSITDFLNVLFSHRRIQPRGSLPVPQQEFAVIGLGRFGASLALTLVERGHTVLGIDQNPALAQDMADQITQTVSLDSTDEDALRDIDIASYQTVVVAIGSQFEANLMTTVALKAVGARNVICKASTERQKSILLSVGADRVVLPEHDSGRRIAQELALPGILDQIALTQNIRVSELRCPPKYAGKSLKTLDLEARFGIYIAAALREGEITPHPTGSFVFMPDDLLIVIGDETNVARLVAP